MASETVIRVVAEIDPKIDEAITDIKRRLERLERPVDRGTITVVGPNGRAVVAAAGDTVRVAALKVPMRDEKPVRSPQEVLAARMPEAVRLGQRQALSALLGALDDWIAGARDNHDALEHRNEPVGSECWRSFTPSDIRTMVNDAARELNIPGFNAPAEPVEDWVPSIEE